MTLPTPFTQKFGSKPDFFDVLDVPASHRIINILPIVTRPSFDAILTVTVPTCTQLPQVLRIDHSSQKGASHSTCIVCDRHKHFLGAVIHEDHDTTSDNLVSYNSSLHSLLPIVTRPSFDAILTVTVATSIQLPQVLRNDHSSRSAILYPNYGLLGRIFRRCSPPAPNAKS